MERGLIQRKNLETLVAAIRAKAALFAPVADREGTVYRQVSSAAEIRLDAANTRLSIKGVFFPQRERLVSFTGGAMEEAPVPTSGIVVFGVRPCDARSLLFMDKVFSGEAGAPGNVVHQDPFYLERMKNGIVIALACDEPGRACFCTSVGGDPHGTAGADILASITGGEGGENGDGSGLSGDAPASGSLLFEAVTEKGARFMNELVGYFEPESPELLSELSKAREARARAAAAMMPRLDFTGVKEKMDAGFESPLWERIARTCLGCGVCTYSCPTCHCFDITDETLGARGARLRTWDSCQYPLYTAHASGHNPRPAKRARMRQRIMHKYSYTVETAGMISCSGCGRCVRACPVNLDIRQMLAALKETP